MILSIRTSKGIEATVECNNPGTPDTLIVEGKETQNYAFIAPNMEEMVAHFLESEDTDFAVGLREGATSITTATKESLISVKFNKTMNIQPLGELTPVFVPEITSVLIASFQDPKDHINNGTGVISVTDFEILGTITEIRLLS